MKSSLEGFYPFGKVVTAADAEVVAPAALETSEVSETSEVLTFLGNRTAMTKTIASAVAFTHVYEYDDANRLTKVDDQAYTWDANGNLQNNGVFTFTYDATNRLITATNGTTLTLGYRYNGDGVLVAQTVDGVETTFVQDVGGPLSQILVETSGSSTKRHLYGVAGVLAWTEGDAWVYPLKDALGSVRQLTDGDGDVTLAQGYTPFGVLLWSEGSGASGYGYTGDQEDAGVALVFLRARYYDPYLSRFINKDPWPENYRRDLTLNDYLYAIANPVNSTDPSGLYLAVVPGAGGIPEPDYRDLTDWLYRELIHNVNDPKVHQLRTWNAIAKGWGAVGLMACGAGLAAGQPIIGVAGGIVIVGGMVFHATALYEYSQLVKNGARWDVKDEIGIKLGPGITLCSSGSCFNDIEYSVVGNIHFAYIGGAAGIFGWEIQAGAAWAEKHDPAHDPNSVEYVGPYEGVVEFGSTWWDPDTWNFGDEPKDHEAVTLGIKLWEKYRDNMTRAQFESELAGYVSKFAHHPPRTKPVVPDVAADWPYPVGYFDNVGRVYNINQE